MTAFHVLLPTDVFPPVTGGAGWSSFALARALQRRGHRVTAIVPLHGRPGLRRRDQDGVPVVEVGYRAPSVPFVQNYYRFEHLWPLLRDTIVAEAGRETELPLLVHGQHAQTIPAAVLAGRELNIPVVATVRDAWPWHYFATGLLGDRLPFRPAGPLVDWLDLVGRLPPLRSVLAAGAIPYMRAHVRRRAALLAQADAVVACSRYMRQRLETLVPAERLHMIPHLIDVEATRKIAEAGENSGVGVSPTVDGSAGRAAGASRPERYVLFVGKLEHNKGPQLLPAALAAARDAGAELPPLLIAGSGGLEAELRRELDARTLEYSFVGGWVDHDEVLRLMRRAEVLVFPSAWGEPLSRVLLEGCAVGACIAAIDTGGTGDAIVDGVSGLLARDERQLGLHIARLLAEPTLRSLLREGAERIARERFAEGVVIRQIEELYDSIRE